MSVEGAPQKVLPEKRSSLLRAIARDTTSTTICQQNQQWQKGFLLLSSHRTLLRARADNHADNMASATLLTVRPVTPLNLQDLGADMLEEIMIKMPPRDAFQSRGTSTALYGAGTSEPLWTVHLDNLLESAAPTFYVPDASKHACEQYFSAASHLSQQRGRKEAHIFVAYNKTNEEGVFEYEHLSELGEVIGVGQGNADFVPAAPIQLPQPAIIALSLLRLFSTCMVKDTGKPVDKWRKAGGVLGVDHSSLRRLASRFPTDLRTPAKKARAARELAAPFPTPAATSKAPALAPPPLPIARAAPAPNESVRYLKRKADKLEVENLQLREQNRCLRQKVQEQAADLHAERQMRARDAASRNREVFRLTQRIAALEHEGMERSQVNEGDLARAKKRLEDERDRSRQFQARIGELRRSLHASGLEKECAILTKKVAAQEVLIAEAIRAAEAEREASRLQKAAALAGRREAQEALQRYEQTTRVRLSRTKEKHAQWKADYWAETLAQGKEGVHSPNKRAIAASVINSVQLGAEVRLPQPNAKRNGPGVLALRVGRVVKGSADGIQQRTAKQRNKTLSNVLDAVSGGGESNTVQLLADHAKANPKLYKVPHSSPDPCRFVSLPPPSASVAGPAWRPVVQ